MIEHRLFKPITLSIIVSFVLFRGFEYARSFIADYQDFTARKSQFTPIKINILSSSKLDIDEQQILEHKIKSGDTLLKILIDIGADEKEIFTILDAMKKVFAPHLIAAGDDISVQYSVRIAYDSNKEDQQNFNRKAVIHKILITPSPEEQIIILRKNEGVYDVKKNKLKLNRSISRYFGVINNGLFSDGVAAGISPTSMMNMIGLYGYDVDFQRDIREGDKFEMLIESFYDDGGKKIKDGNVLFSSLNLQNRKIDDIYMHKVDGKIEYFDSKGSSVRKSLLRTPINGARVSSGFGMRRHPILGYSKMHKGTDFAASTGTPILAAGNGVIAYFGVKGGYGNYVQIKHNAEYSTAYGHASKFNKKFYVGAKVRQGDVVAYVGSTGRSTGAHLHFEVLYKGEQINPAKVKATSGLKLTGKELTRFEVSRSEIDRYRKSIPNQIRR